MPRWNAECFDSNLSKANLVLHTIPVCPSVAQNVGLIIKMQVDMTMGL